MKIDCYACGKKYDTQRYGGICPNCGMHAAEDQLAAAQEYDVVKGSSVSEVLRSYLNEKLRREKKKSFLRQKKIQIPLCLLLTAAIIGVFIWGNYRYQERLDYYMNTRSTAQMHTEEHRLGDSVVLIGGTDIVSASVRITGCRVRDDLQSKVSGGDFKIIEVTYEDSGTPISVRLSPAFIVTEGGCTAQCFEKYDIMAATGMTEDEYYESDYCDGVFSTHGRGRNTHRMLFAAPKAETEHRLLLFRQSDAYAQDKTIEMRYDFILREGEAL